MLITHVQLRKGYKKSENTVDECCSIVLSLLFNDYLASVVHERMSTEHWRNDGGENQSTQENSLFQEKFPPPHKKTHMVCPGWDQGFEMTGR